MTFWDVLSVFFDPKWLLTQFAEKPVAMTLLMVACGTIGFAIKDHLMMRETSELNSEIGRLASTTNLQEHKIDQLTSQLESAKPRAERADSLEKELRDARDRLNEKEHEIDRLTVRLAASQKMTLEDFVASVVEAYEASTQPLTSRDIDEIIAAGTDDKAAGASGDNDGPIATLPASAVGFAPYNPGEDEAEMIERVRSLEPSLRQTLLVLRRNDYTNLILREEDVYSDANPLYDFVEYRKTRYEGDGRYLFRLELSDYGAAAADAAEDILLRSEYEYLHSSTESQERLGETK